MIKILEYKSNQLHLGSLSTNINGLKCIAEIMNDSETILVDMYFSCIPSRVQEKRKEFIIQK